MPASQQHITPNTPLGATVAPGGAAFRVWAPGASAVYVALHDAQHPAAEWSPSEEALLVRQDGGYWTGFFPGVRDGALYRYWTVGPGGEGYKRDPRALELELNGYPDCDCIVRGPNDYPWHDAGFRRPALRDLIIYQFHIGVFYAVRDGRDIRRGRVSKFLDVLDRLEYLAALGVNAIQPLPVVEWQSIHSRGYNNTDLYSPEMDYAVPPEELDAYVNRVNQLLAAKEQPPARREYLNSQVDQLKALIDLCHLYGIAVLLDVVYNHAGPLDDQSLRFFDRPWNRAWWDPDLYFIGGDGWAGGRIFDFKRNEVRQFLIDNARLFLDEFHVDGFRYDEVSVIYNNEGANFCRDLMGTLQDYAPSSIHIAEYWNWDRATAVIPRPQGLGFNAALHDGLRNRIRGVLAAAAGGASARVDLDAIRDGLWRPVAFPSWMHAVNHIENHDLVDGDREKKSEIQPRIPALANDNNRRDWLARSRSRVATGLLLTAPGVPMLFMGQEFLEDKPWHNSPDREDLFLYWDGLKQPGPMRDFLRFVSELCALRRRHPALRAEGINPYFTHNDDRVIACQRWIEGVGRDVIVVASLRETTHWDYQLPFPVGGRWLEGFNSDAYDSLPDNGGYNPGAVGNPWGVTADGPPAAGCPTSAHVLIPANALLVFARDAGD